MNLEFHPAAEEELREAYDYYSREDPAVAAEFLAILDQSLESLVNHPTRFPLFVHGTRRMLIRKFPYQLVYICQEGRVLVLAVAHSRREPNYWTGRP